MTNLEKLQSIVNSNHSELLQWLGKFANWYDPGGWHDDSTLNTYLNEEWPIAKFNVGDIIMEREGPWLGVITHIDYEYGVYSILLSNSRAESESFESIEKEWKETGRKIEGLNKIFAEINFLQEGHV